MTYKKLTVSDFAAKCHVWRANIYEIARNMKQIDYEEATGAEPFLIVMSPKTEAWMEAQLARRKRKEKVG